MVVNVTKFSLFFALFLYPMSVLALDDCPFGEADCSCKYPGECGRYIDVDSNQICDHSQSAFENLNFNRLETTQVLKRIPELKLKAVEVANHIKSKENSKSLSQIYDVKIKVATSGQVLKENNEIEPSVVENITSLQRVERKPIISEPQKGKNKRVYPILSVVIVLTLMYSATLFLSKRKHISVLTHRRIWNVLLLATFLISGILGFLLIIRINYGIVFPQFLNELYWHVELGMAMFLISIIHIIERWHFFKKMLRKK